MDDTTTNLIRERDRAEEAVRRSEEHYRELLREAHQMQQSLRELSDRILAVQEEERTRLSRDLHDEIGQALTAIGIHLGVLQQTPAGEAVAQRAADALRLLQQTSESIHRLARELRPAILDDLGLLPALRQHVQAFIERTGLELEYRVDADDGIERLDPERKTVLYRVVQEGLNNIAKHARAKAAQLFLQQDPHAVHLRLSDNGQGFIPCGQRGPASGRLGLVGIRERVRLVDGQVAIESELGTGTVLRISVPFKAA